MVDNLRSQNEVLDRIMSFPAYLQNGCQIRRRNLQNAVVLSSPNFAAILPGDSVAGMVVANGILNNTILVVRLVLTWFPNAPPACQSPQHFMRPVLEHIPGYHSTTWRSRFITYTSISRSKRLHKHSFCIAC